MDLLLFISLTPKKLISPKSHGFYLMIPNTNAQNRVLLFLSLKFVYWAILSCSLTHDKAFLMSYIFHAKLCRVKWTWSTNANNCALSNSSYKVEDGGADCQHKFAKCLVNYELCWKIIFGFQRCIIKASSSCPSNRHFKYILDLTDKMFEKVYFLNSFFKFFSHQLIKIKWPLGFRERF